MDRADSMDLRQIERMAMWRHPRGALSRQMLRLLGVQPKAGTSKSVPPYWSARFHIGERVELVSGGPVMTLARGDDESGVFCYCQWFDGGIYHEARFHSCALRSVDFPAA